MNYSQTGIANLALNRIGARGAITDINERNPNAAKVSIVWNPIFQEVLSERDWKFAKTRTTLQLFTQYTQGSPPTNAPLYSYCAAWTMPSDYLRFVRPHRKQYNDNWFWGWGLEGEGWYNRQDPPVWPYCAAPYIVEAMPNGLDSSGNPAYIQCLLTNYAGGQCNNNTTPPTPSCPIKINYIRLITDYTQLLPGFVNCLAYRLAAELAIGITEDKNKFEGMMQLYRDTLNSAEAQNETMDYQKDEAGSESWVRAGRYIRGQWW